MESETFVDDLIPFLKITVTDDPFGIATIIDHVGKSNVSSGEYKTAIKYYEKSLQIYREIGHLSGTINSNVNLGDTHHKLAQYQTAIEYYKNSLDISTAMGEQLGIARSNGRLGIVYCGIGKDKQAIDCFEEALKIYTATGNRLGIASMNGNLGNAYRSLGEYQKAINCCEKSLEINTAIDDQSGIAVNNNNLGIVYCDLGEYQKAIKYHEKSLETSSAIDDQSGIARNNGNLGNAHRMLGEYQKAIKYYEKSLEFGSAIGDQPRIARNNCNLGSTYYDLGEYSKAIKYFEKGLEISSAIGNRSVAASSNGNLGNAYARLGEYKKAIKYLEKDLEISSAIGDQSKIGLANGNLGIALHALGESQKAIKHYEKGLEVSSAIGDQRGMAENHCNLGNAYSGLGQYQKAVKYHEKSLEISSAIGYQSGIAWANLGLGRAYFDSGEYEDARSHLEEAIRIFDKIFLNFVPDPNKLSFTSKYVETHHLLMSCFLFLERAKSALLVIDLGKAKELHFCIEKYKNCAATEMDDFALTTWNRIRACEEEVEIEEIQQILQMEKNDTSILAYAFEGDILNIWVLNKDFVFRKLGATEETIFSVMLHLLKMKNVTLGRNSSFQEDVSVENIYNPVILSRKPQPKGAIEKNSNFGSSLEILKHLFLLLIDPVKDSLKGNKLIVVPDRLLFFAPFSSLVDENDRFLTSNYSIQITPSLHTLKASMQRANDTNIGFALFIGNPNVEKVSLNGEVFTSLPGAAEEVKYLANLFQAKPLLGSEARKQVVLQHLSEASIIHIAAHAESQRGEIILAPNTSHDQPKPESFLLTQEDITSISVQARLVVLCCCYTGQGEVSSEGVIGITRSFLAAGARSVLSTLWPINDVATIEFMKKFYHELLEETSVCEALRRAQNLFQEHENCTYQSTKIWAPFTIYGEDVKFEKQEIEEIKEKSRVFFDDFVVLP